MPSDSLDEINEYTVDYRGGDVKNSIRSVHSGVGTLNSGPENTRGASPVVATAGRQINRVTAVGGVKNVKSFNEYSKQVAYQQFQEEGARDNSDREHIYIKAPKHTFIYSVLMGCLVLILAVIGVLVLVSNLKRTALYTATFPMPIHNAVFSNYDQILFPVVMQDPEPFASPQEASPEMMVSSSIWRAIYKKGAADYSSFDGDGKALMPASDVKDACEELFGDFSYLEGVISSGISGNFFKLSAGDDNFHIAAISNCGSYFPYVQEEAVEDKEILLKVGYAANVGRNEDAPLPVKYMHYRLKKSEENNKFYIYSVEKIV